MSDALDAWNEGTPPEAGWYAALLWWGPNKPSLPAARYWTGQAWTMEPDGTSQSRALASIRWLPGTEETREDAYARAQANDPDL